MKDENKRGVGQPSKWKSPKTIVMRIPEYLKERILKIAHVLDENKEKNPKVNITFEEK